MLNKKEMFLNKLDTMTEWAYDFYEDNQDMTDKYIFSINLMKSLLEIRFENTLKQYNNDKDRAWDNYSVKNILNQINLYIEEFYLIDKESNNFNLSTRNCLRQILNTLWSFFNNNYSNN